MNRLLVWLVAFVALCGNSGAALAGVSYTLTDLGTLGGTFSQAFAINNSGQVVGQAGTPEDKYLAFLYTPGSAMQELATISDLPGDTMYLAAGINAGGQVVGFTHGSATGGRHALLWNGAGAVQDLGTLGGTGSVAVQINDSGQIVGTAATAGGEDHGFLYSGSGLMRDLGTLGGSWSSASDINRYGQIVGTAMTAEWVDHAFLYSAGAMQDLGTLPGGRFSGASSMNDLGQIVGGSDNDRPFLYSGSGPMQELPRLGSLAVPRSINNLGQVVGYGDNADGQAAALFWPGDGRVLDLGALIDPSSGWTLIQANDINDRGQIVGYGTRADGYAHAFLLTPIPEPSTPSLLVVTGLGLVAFAWRARSRKQ